MRTDNGGTTMTDNGGTTMTDNGGTTMMDNGGMRGQTPHTTANEGQQGNGQWGVTRRREDTPPTTAGGWVYFLFIYFLICVRLRRKPCDHCYEPLLIGWIEGAG